MSKMTQQKAGIEVVDAGDYRVIRPGGHLDVYTVGTLRDTITELVQDSPGMVVVDLDEVSFMDSSGLGALVGGVRRLREAGGDLAVKCTNEQHLKLLEATGLGDEMPVSATLDAAASLKR